MNGQTPMFDSEGRPSIDADLAAAIDARAFRATDPSTSAEAARLSKVTRHKLAPVVLDVLTRNGPMSDEQSHHRHRHFSGQDPHIGSWQKARRALVLAGLVTNTGQRVRTETGATAQTWRIIEAHEPAYRVPMSSPPPKTRRENDEAIAIIAEHRMRIVHVSDDGECLDAECISRTGERLQLSCCPGECHCSCEVPECAHSAALALLLAA